MLPVKEAQYISTQRNTEVLLKEKGLFVIFCRFVFNLNTYFDTFILQLPPIPLKQRNNFLF